MRHMYINKNRIYVNECWCCGTLITSERDKRCSVCGWFMCPKCGRCSKECPHRDENGYDRLGFDINRLHKNGTPYDDEGYDINGNDIDGFNRNGIDADGYNRQGYNQKGFNRKGFHKNGTPYDDEGYDINGNDIDGFNRNGIDADGYNRQGYNQKGFNRKGFHKNGTCFDDNGLNEKGLDEYDLKSNKYTIGTKVIFKGQNGEIIESRFHKEQKQIIKIKLCDNSVVERGLKALIKNDLIEFSK